METSRRGFITGLISFTAAAPAIVRAASLMPVKVIPPGMVTRLEVPASMVIPYLNDYEIARLKMLYQLDAKGLMDAGTRLLLVNKYDFKNKAFGTLE